MRARVVLLIAAIALVALFAAFNWSEFVRPSPLSFGLFITEAPLGLIMLALLGATALLALAAIAGIRTNSLVESRHHHKTLEAQRELADKAEASRFTELRQHLDRQLTELRQRDTIAATEFEKAMVAAQRELRTTLEQMNRAMAMNMKEFEARIDTRLDRMASAPLLRDPVGVQSRDDRIRTDPIEPPPKVRHPL
ncbi:MAG: hypothetical protein HY854_16550 [Burkholderiales bacterium]|nr:hypothetical protein [Burkholderiales bacterium]